MESSAKCSMHKKMSAKCSVHKKIKNNEERRNSKTVPPIGIFYGAPYNKDDGRLVAGHFRGQSSP